MHSRSCTTSYSYYYFHNHWVRRSLALMTLLYSSVQGRTFLSPGGSRHIAPEKEVCTSVGTHAAPERKEGSDLVHPHVKTVLSACPLPILLFAFLQNQAFHQMFQGETSTRTSVEGRRLPPRVFAAYYGSSETWLLMGQFILDTCVAQCEFSLAERCPYFTVAAVLVE